MAQPRIKSSFIYLANAVNDLRGNWVILAAVLAPLIALAAMCLLPEALNAQHWVAFSLGRGGTSVGYFAVQEPYHPATTPSPAPYSDWLIYTMRTAVVLISQVAELLVLVELKRIQTAEQASGIIAETIAVYASAARLALAYLWIAILQYLALGIAVVALKVGIGTDYPILWMMFSIARFALLVVAGIAYLWLYFAEYALVFDGQRSFHALLFSRDLMRKRFFRVASRIAVFLAVGWGYNSLALGAFVIASVLLGPVVQITGVVSTIIVGMNLVGLSVSVATAAFFIAAGVRMYQDLTAIAREGAGSSVGANPAPEQATAQLGAVGV
ncbi:MAG TPA: hypothetical protein VMV27_05015 [Candidatus Binataceae bacterium]|nr:hypothetical protein [Candidatus Binataceae bacterium]